MEAILQQITSLRRATTKLGPAPHKPILLLALLELFDEKKIDRNWIEIDDPLLTRFYDIWNLLAGSVNTPNFALTFFHMGNERRNLWNLTVLPGKTIVTTHKLAYKSLKALKETFLGARLSDEFYSAIKNRQTRDAIKSALLTTYFPNNSFRKRETAQRYSKKIEAQILYGPVENNAGNAIRNIQDESIESTEEEIILRNFIFKKAVLGSYNYQCAVSGLKIEEPNDEFLVDACHIIPFIQSGDNSIRNGIALSPTLHRAFYNGLIAIDDNYKILVHTKLKDCNPMVGIRQYENKAILLPTNEQFYPSLHRLAEHRARFGY